VLQRIHIAGGPGSGKTYAARLYLICFPRYDFDDLFSHSAAQSHGVRASDADRDVMEIGAREFFC
jgi:adenylate kinase family enzyme